MSEYRRGTHSVFRLHIHVVWCTKYRKGVLVGNVGYRFRDLAKQMCTDMGVEILSGVVAKDHVHLLVSILPQVSVSKLVQKLKGTSQKVRRAQILLKANANGPSWSDKRIAEAFSCWTSTVEKVRQHLVERGFDETLDGKKRATPPTEKLLDGEQEAKIIATRLGPPPKGYANWTLRLLARKVVELEIVDSISYETVRRTLKKTE